MSRIELNYLVFDDDSEAIFQYQDKIRIEGCTVNPIVINPVDFYVADSNKFKLEDFKENIKQETKGRNINLIITDWNILDRIEDFSGIKGWDIIEWVIQTKEKWKSRTFLIYSSNIKKASDYILEKIKKEIKDKPDDIIPSLEFIREIIELKIKFCKRDENRFDEIKTLLKQSNTISNIVLDSLISFDTNTILNTGNADYDGKKILDILNLNNQDIGKLKFIREFIELSIAHYSKLNG
ncbi:hypothetical protein UJ101_01710 [Flavobacteriaceae bacterium UJ101]|nr:hypothetical protein UJ101_01710 [Flavobacteriaceae bacterium UJ101]